MTDQAAEAALPAGEAALPRSAAIIEAFRSGTEPADELPRLAVRLARQHQDQWAAETVSRARWPPPSRSRNPSGPSTPSTAAMPR